MNGLLLLIVQIEIKIQIIQISCVLFSQKIAQIPSLL